MGIGEEVNWASFQVDANQIHFIPQALAPLATVKATNSMMSLWPCHHSV